MQFTEAGLQLAPSGRFPGKESWGALGLRGGKSGVHSWDGGPRSQAQDWGGAGEGRRQLQQQGRQVAGLPPGQLTMLQHQRPEDPRHPLPTTRARP